MPFDTNRGALFRNEEKKEGYPDYSGVLNISGVEYKLSGWLQTSKKGTKYLSIAARLKTDNAKSPEVSDAEPF